MWAARVQVRRQRSEPMRLIIYSRLHPSSNLPLAWSLQMRSSCSSEVGQAAYGARTGPTFLMHSCCNVGALGIQAGPYCRSRLRIQGQRPMKPPNARRSSLSPNYLGVCRLWKRCLSMCRHVSLIHTDDSVSALLVRTVVLDSQLLILHVWDRWSIIVKRVVLMLV